MTEWLEIIDRLDVPTVLVVVVYGFWYLHKQLIAVQTVQAVQTEALAALVTEVKQHALHDHAEHQRLYDKIDTVRELANGA